MKRLKCGALLLLLSTGCAGNLPEPGHPSQPPTEAAVPPTLGAPVEAKKTGSPEIDAAYEIGTQALVACDEVLGAIPSQQLQIKNKAYARKQGGLLVTTAVGVAGSVITAIFAGNQKAETDGSVNTKPATIAGASTAGGTAIAGVISLWVVGSGADERVELLTDRSKTLQDAEANYNTKCATIAMEKVSECKREALRLSTQCGSVRSQLPYVVPPSVRRVE